MLLLCAAYLQGGIDKVWDFQAAVAEMIHFGLPAPALFATLTIVVEFAAPALILFGVQRWAGALVLAGFTLIATFVANRFWEPGVTPRLPIENAFFEHLGLVGGFLLIAWDDLRERCTKVSRTHS